MKLTINSRKLGMAFNFFTVGNGSYIYLETSGSDSRQICNHGQFTGCTLMANNEADFNKICRKWYRDHLSEAEFFYPEIDLEKVAKMKNNKNAQKGTNSMDAVIQFRCEKSVKVKAIHSASRKKMKLQEFLIHLIENYQE